MEEKLKKLAQALTRGIREYDTVADVYTSLRDKAKSQFDYFSRLGPQNFLKLVFYIYSLKNSNSFELGEKMLYNLAFSQLVDSENELHIETCDECDGQGVVECPECYRGFVSCQTCDGDGELEMYGQPVDCVDCGGDGEVDCRLCGRNGLPKGEVLCDKCEGQGEYKSKDEYNYEIYFIMSWNVELNELCQTYERTKTPIMSYDELLKFEKDFVLLSKELGHGPLDVDPNQIYCINYSDEPKIFWSSLVEPKIHFSSSNFLVKKSGSPLFDIGSLY